uniref:Uncharacterized protein n=1 Tax=Magnetococcus massalia (strain MO-1) TaxID=451514 RepID=A0A1S7LLJ5_MAGMO|nr:Conserved protein of unknown function [Candidatus Magnetococcus massalia]
MGSLICVENRTETQIHVQALNSTGFHMSLAPGEKRCCSSEGCRTESTPLIILSGYIPISTEGQPGWRSECRTQAEPGETVIVDGTLDAIRCAP